MNGLLVIELPRLTTSIQYDLYRFGKVLAMATNPAARIGAAQCKSYVFGSDSDDKAFTARTAEKPARELWFVAQFALPPPVGEVIVKKR
jgi:hypothetical protein